jgi:MFS family permease
MQDAGVTMQDTILVYAAFNLVAALISYPAGALSDTWGRRVLLFVAFVVFFLAYLGFALRPGPVLVGAAFVFYGLYQGIYRAVGKALAADFAPPRLRASGIGWYSTTVGVQQLLASVVAGIFWDRIGHAAVFYYGAACALAGSVGLLALGPGKPPRQVFSVLSDDTDG